MPKRRSGFSAKRELKGFTLIELLVVISIISILATLAVSAYSNLQKNSRDAKRKSDLSIIQSALEQYRADQHNYPVTGNVGIGTTSLTSPDGSRVYIKSLPSEPKLTPQYSYQAQPEGCTNEAGSYCTKYYLCANMEIADNKNDAPDCDGVTYLNAYEVVAP